MTGPATSERILLETRDLDVHYGAVAGLRQANLRIGEGQFVAVLGSNGAGKSSLLKGIMRLAKATGSVRFDSRELLELPSHALIRAGIALVPEGRQVFSTLTVEENLLVGAQSLPRKKRRAAVEQMYDTFEVLKVRPGQQAGTLSGGQQQILAIARAIVSGPKMCLMDEPSLGLAPVLVEEVFHEIKRLSQSGMTLLVVEQLASVVLSVADRGYVLEHGQVRLDGTSSELRENPEVQRRYLGVSESSSN
jgi:branched-chain amino acid transport system ATP-binding protein